MIPQYGLQCLHYFIELNVDTKVHDALGDITVLEALFRCIHARFLIPRMPFGKHKGALFSEIPADCLQWLLGTDLDGYLAYTLRHHLGQNNIAKA